MQDSGNKLRKLTTKSKQDARCKIQDKKIYHEEHEGTQR